MVKGVPSMCVSPGLISSNGKQSSEPCMGVCPFNSSILEEEIEGSPSLRPASTPWLEQ